MKSNEEESADGGNHQQEVEEEHHRNPRLPSSTNEEDQHRERAQDPPNRKQHRPRPVSGWTKFSAVTGAIFSLCLVAVGVAQVCVYIRQEAIMHTQAKIEARQQSDQRIFNRAWVGANIVPMGLTYSVDGATFSFNSTLINAGHSPAFHVSALLWVTDERIGSTCNKNGCPMRNPEAEMINYIATVKRAAASGALLLPGGALLGRESSTIPQTELSDITRFGGGAIAPEGFLIIKYRTPFDHAIHLTCYVFQIERVWGDGYSGFKISDGAVPAAQIRIFQNPVFGSPPGCNN